ncbi:MAG: response regulator [Spirochaetales bacterium]|nr:response regulator [Spirochaetales bacterium]
MYRVLAVDDEPLVLEGLGLFSWNDYDTSLAYLAEDGAEALRLVEAERPDIIISDIRMPEIDGLEFSRRALEFNPDAIILLITGYSDFTYAQQALRIGVFDFLVKPVDFESLETAMKKVVQTLNEKKLKNSQIDQMRQQISEDLLEKLLIGSTVQDMKAISNDCRMVIANVYVDDPKGLELSLLRHFFDGMDICRPLRVLYIYEFRRYTLLFRFRCEEQDKALLMKVKNALEDFQVEIWKNYRFSVSIGISDIYDDIEKLSLMRQQALKMLEMARRRGGNNLLAYEDTEKEKISFTEEFKAARNYLYNAIVSRNGDAVDEALSKIGEALGKISNQSLCLEFLWNELLFYVNLPSFEDNPVIDEKVDFAKFSSSVKCLFKVMQDEAIEAGDRNVEVAVYNYIREHYRENISLTTLSDELHYTTSYLSRLIHRSCGESFMKMLIGYRMDKAKEKLELSEESVKDIADSVGYNDVGYFIASFGKQEGCTPAEYREKSRR